MPTCIAGLCLTVLPAHGAITIGLAPLSGHEKLTSVHDCETNPGVFSIDTVDRVHAFGMDFVPFDRLGFLIRLFDRASGIAADASISAPILKDKVIKKDAFEWAGVGVR